jgi:hypothetical protein
MVTTSPTAGAGTSSKQISSQVRIHGKRVLQSDGKDYKGVEKPARGRSKFHQSVLLEKSTCIAPFMRGDGSIQTISSALKLLGLVLTPS